MVLRKPYAFLIKHFKKINVLLLLLVIFVAYQDIKLYGFLRDYVSTAIYNNALDPISNYVTLWGFLSLFIILIISCTLGYLLKYKNKPYIFYLYIALSNLLTLIVFLYMRYYFSPGVYSGYSIEASRNLMYVTLVTVLPYIVSVLLLMIRAVGLDLKKFGFHEDKDFLELDENDREEVEVEVNFDKDIIVRKIRNKIRLFKYFFMEHKFSLSAITIAVVVALTVIIYNYVYVEHKVYGMNETFKSNNYKFVIENTYLTDKDYAGNIISTQGKYYVILDFKVQNLLNQTRDFDIKKFHLFVDDKFYEPDLRFNNYFNDIGKVYEGNSIDKKQTENYILIYEIDRPSKSSNFLLTYQDLLTKDNKVIKIKIKVRDLSKFVNRDSKKMNETLEVPINLDEKKSFNISDFIVTDSTTYTYEKCYVHNCPIYQGTLVGKNGNSILRLRGDLGEDSVESFIKFLSKYGKIRYNIDGTDKEIPLEFMLTKGYRGKMIYLSVPGELKTAIRIELLFTVRTYQYVYKLKGE